MKITHEVVSALFHSSHDANGLEHFVNGILRTNAEFLADSISTHTRPIRKPYGKIPPEEYQQHVRAQRKYRNNILKIGKFLIDVGDWIIDNVTLEADRWEPADEE